MLRVGNSQQAIESIQSAERSRVDTLPPLSAASYDLS